MARWLHRLVNGEKQEDLQELVGCHDLQYMPLPLGRAARLRVCYRILALPEQFAAHAGHSAFCRLTAAVCFFRVSYQRVQDDTVVLDGDQELYAA